jgi:competence protein ComEA
MEFAVKQRLRWVAGHEYARFLGLGALAGLILLTVALVWRDGRNETIVLEVRQVSDPNLLRVYVGGAVHSPGLLSLEPGSRVADAIAAAGGVTPEGDTSGLGMAAPLRDADQIIVATRAVIPSPAETGGPTHPDLSSGATSTIFARAPAVTEAININTASAEQLVVLPGVGPTIAARIVDYRQRHGFYRSIDELEHIQGISTRMVEELRPLVTTGQ